MFGKISTRLDRIAAAVEDALGRLDDLAEGLQTPERLAALEGEIARVKGEARALVQEAEARFNAARASEERNRHQVKRLERLRDLDDEGDEEEEIDWDAYQANHAPGGGSEGVPPVRPTVDLAGEAGEQIAEAFKWGLLPPGYMNDG